MKREKYVPEKREKYVPEYIRKSIVRNNSAWSISYNLVRRDGYEFYFEHSRFEFSIKDSVNGDIRVLYELTGHMHTSPIYQSIARWCFDNYEQIALEKQ